MALRACASPRGRPGDLAMLSIAFRKHVHRNSREGSRCMISGICDFRLTLELLAANGCELQHRQYRSRAQLLDRAVDFGVTLAVLMGQTDRRGTEPRRRVQKMLELQHPLPLWARRSRPRTNPKSSASAVPPLSHKPEKSPIYQPLTEAADESVSEVSWGLVPVRVPLLCRVSSRASASNGLAPMRRC